MIAFVTGGNGHLPRGGLAGFAAFLRPFQAVVGTVTQQVNHRVGEHLDDRLVDLGVAADQVQVDLLVGGLGQVAHHAGVAAEELVDRLHAGLHDPQLQVAGHAVKRRGDLLELIAKPAVVTAHAAVAAGHAQHAVFFEHQLAHEVQQRFEAVDVDPDGGFDRRRRGFCRRFGGPRFGGFGGFGRRRFGRGGRRLGGGFDGFGRGGRSGRVAFQHPVVYEQRREVGDLMFFRQLLAFGQQGQAFAQGLGGKIADHPFFEPIGPPAHHVDERAKADAKRRA